VSVVAYDGYSLAADRAIFANGVRSAFDKIIDIIDVNGKHHVIASVGTLTSLLRFRAWVQAGMKGDAPDMQDAEHLLFHLGDGGVVDDWNCYEAGQPWKPTLPYAMGAKVESGVALAMMLYGLSAHQTVAFMLATDRFENIGFGVIDRVLTSRSAR
jgi:hypothetical protein